jgi:uncharacterized protein YqjF (DUF2071 family)
MVDRLAPAERPMGRPAGFQRWRQLLFLHWEVDPEAARASLPPPLELDTFEGKAFCGVVAFTMRDVSPWWSPSVPGISNFHELNVRTYAVCGGVPGVWFYSLDAASSLAVSIARIGWHLPYHKARMELGSDAEGVVHYASDRRWPKPKPARLQARYRVGEGQPRRAEPGTLDHFLIERYVLFAARGDGAMRVGRVHHEAYPLTDVTLDDVEDNMIEATGLTRREGPPLVHYSEGVDVDVYALTALDGSDRETSATMGRGQ